MASVTGLSLSWWDGLRKADLVWRGFLGVSGIFFKLDGPGDPSYGFFVGVFFLASNLASFSFRLALTIFAING